MDFHFFGHGSHGKLMENQKINVEKQGAP